MWPLCHSKGPKCMEAVVHWTSVEFHLLMHNYLVGTFIITYIYIYIYTISKQMEYKSNRLQTHSHRAPGKARSRSTTSYVPLNDMPKQLNIKIQAHNYNYLNSNVLMIDSFVETCSIYRKVKSRPGKWLSKQTNKTCTQFKMINNIYLQYHLPAVHSLWIESNNLSPISLRRLALQLK